MKIGFASILYFRIVLVAAIGTAVSGISSKATGQTVENLRPQVFLWAAGDNAQARRPLGTGFILGPGGDVLTAKSVVMAAQGDRLFVSIGSKSKYPVEVDMSDVDCAATQNFCFVRIPADTIADGGVTQFYDVGCYIPVRGSRVSVAGFLADDGTASGVLIATGAVAGAPLAEGQLPISPLDGGGWRVERCLTRILL